MKFPDFIDNTMRKAFAVCPTKFKYEFVRNVMPVGAKSIHLEFGSAFAVGLEVARKGFFVHGLKAEDAIDSGICSAVKDFEGADSEGTYKTADRLEKALRYYFKTWPLQEEMIVPVEGGIECSFELPLPILHPDTGKPIMYVGRYDMLGRDDAGRLWVVDEKTASKLGDMWDAKWDLDCQITGYIWSVKQRIKRGDTSVLFGPWPEATDVRGMVRAVSILKDRFDHAEVPIIRSAWYIDRWYGQLCRDVQRAVASYKSGTWDMALHENACVQFGRKCDYNPLCLTPHPERIIEGGMYTERNWSPLNKGE